MGHVEDLLLHIALPLAPCQVLCTPDESRHPQRLTQDTGHWTMGLESKGRLTHDTGRWALSQNGCGAYNYDKNDDFLTIC